MFAVEDEAIKPGCTVENCGVDGDVSGIEEDCGFGEGLKSGVSENQMRLPP